MRLSTCISLSLCLLLFRVAGAAADTRATLPTSGPTTHPARASVQLATLEVYRDLSDKVLQRISERPDTLRFFSTRGTQFTLLVSLPERTMVRLEPAETRIETFADDLGDLPITHEVSLRGRESSIDDRVIFTDGHHAMLSIFFKALPHAGASTVRIKGSVRTQVCGEAVVGAPQPFTFAPGAKLTAGKNTLTLQSANALGRGQDGLRVVLKVDGQPEAIKDIAFRDADGKLIPSELEQRGFTDERYDRNDRHWLSAVLVRAHGENFTATITYYGAIDRLDVPFDLTAGVGW